jgi:glycosyltransferase involved in cell wall biosynthesis
MRIKFSILITSCNYGKFIRSAINSVLQSKKNDVELIIFDDCSSDNSWDIINQLCSNIPNCNLLRGKFQDGQANALNEAFFSSKGDYLLFMDADDLFMEEKLYYLRCFIDAGNNFGIIQHDLIEIDEGGASLGTRFGVNSSATGCKLYGGSVLGRILDQDTPYSWFFAPTSGLCLRRDFAEKIFPLPSEFRICADVPIAYGAAVLGEVGLIEEPLGCYRLHSKSGYASQLKSSPPGWAAEQFLNSLERYSLLLDMQKTGKFEALANRDLPNLQKYERYWEFFYRVVHPCVRFAAYKLVSLRFAEFRAGKVDFWYLVSKLFDDLVFMLNFKERREYRKAFYSRFHRLSWTSRMLLGSH